MVGCAHGTEWHHSGEQNVLGWRNKRITSYCLSNKTVCLCRDFSLFASTHCSIRKTSSAHSLDATFIASTFLARLSSSHTQSVALSLCILHWHRIRFGISNCRFALLFCYSLARFNLSTASKRQREIDFWCCQCRWCILISIIELGTHTQKTMYRIEPSMTSILSGMEARIHTTTTATTKRINFSLYAEVIVC